MKTQKSDFGFKFSGYGHYKVYYESPITGKLWSKVIDDMQLLDSVKNTDNPKRQDLNTLKRIVKTGIILSKY